MDTSKKTEPPLSVEMVQQRANPDRSPSASIYVPEQGGYKEKFVNAVEDKYKCEKCHLILCNPKQTECGHRFCETCMNALLSSSSPKCTACQESIVKDKVFKDNCCRRELLALQIYCRNENKGCKEQLSLGQLLMHLKTDCQFEELSCPRADCKEKILRKDLPDHVEKTCKYRETTCKYCKSQVPMIMLQVALLQNESLEKNKSIQTLHNQICSFEIEIERQKEMLRNNESKILHLQRVIDSQAEKLKELDKEIRPFRQNWEEADSMKSSVESLQNRVTELESVDKTAGQGARNTSLLETQLSRHDQMLSVHDIRLADMDLRFQVLETASYNGVLIWKIRDYKRRKQEAVMGKTLSLYSQPFYTGYFGYKMCARVYLNGDGMGKGTHLSLFFVIMRGEYDALLPWPFKQKVTLMLMDQGPSRRHLGDAFKPDPNSSSFKKPTGEMNIASGCPVFVAQTVLENGTYIKDDTIFIKVIVDTSDLPDP
ncbi:TNF receptor-associated factor 3 isoform X5 [Numenius arquata]|uniref:TNF receptor-associated factor 3 isoform X3 n=1 Tax=Merops nubicus TaxID=57421 RepID=UPI0003872A7F|nr:PREDICTED: TNF receptor-associated factor 3 isoform X3 [Merops nubicus]XP_009579007.1 PREDICTED: TNF receptor-associated factor 3 isoform X3 [Fulmarus glacialis]XP_009889357.1 PREDICTED: TNF receptor-associated factor 3 isoform X3 [Charadrius vociferus]XP_009935145.1 PREDICTED: TNF receptor-associated factor 3 isoform X3 [Opisthocomus hoazin]XP_010115189.1 PREDICTED: TNF receptor-associated factor 3 isoform X3 [Chlamydotis macqueenii]XP_030339141.1 TNF receptor-associated factor 3 isoform X